MFVHVADDGIGMGHFRNLAEAFAGVPFDDLAERASRMVGGGLEIEFAIKGVRVSGVSHHTATSAAGPFGDDKIGASIQPRRQHNAAHEYYCEKYFFHNLLIIK